ncbi:transketolase [Amycolatopsis sp. AA4]|uniref:transketolase family protein n=1 Tax=Actinomycetes TaxID=1760 RepID=UPI0001B55534|nr:MULTISPECIES: transketolase [Actinomycetes]ATY10628.1 transketolase [Amycolatopsis sp. AA4]EFL06133.1 transketolase central region [Streptomyces sp. AA4]
MPNMRDTFLATAEEIVNSDPDVAIVLADISTAALAEAARRHPDRVLNVGIREQLLVSTGAGLALAGLRPIVHTFNAFLVERAFEQIKLDLSHQELGAVLVSYGASYDMPMEGRTHQAPGDVALIDSLPGWYVHIPGHPEEARRLLLDSVPGDSRTYLRLSAQENSEPHLGVGLQTIHRGARGVVIAVGPMLDRVLEATEDMDVTVLYTSTVRPFDVEGLRAAVTDVAEVALVEPYLKGTSAHCVADALADRPHRLLNLGTRRDTEVRIYGTLADHDLVHGLDAGSIALSLKEFFTG